MPGNAIQKWLEPHSYERFYRVAHAYSEHLLTAASKIKATTDVAARLAQNLADSSKLVSYKKDTQRLSLQGETLQESVRACFWPEMASRMMTGMPLDGARELDDAFNQQRWQPYDGRAWDQFVAGIGAQIRPALDDFRLRAEALVFPDDYVASVPSQQIAFLLDLTRNLRQYSDALENLLEPEEVDKLFS
jgi:hypothetical protein